MQTRQMLCRPCFMKRWLTLACVRYSERTSTPCSTRCTVQQAVKSTFQLTPTEFSNQAQQITDSYGKIIFDRNAKAEKPTEEPQTEEPKNEDPKAEANDQQKEKGERTNAPAKDGIEKDKEKVGTNKQDNRTDNSVKEWENSFLLSQETDQNNSPFILSSSGSIDFGQISARHNLPSAPVRLSLGDAENGYRHINRRHGQQIKDNGFNSIQEFVEYVLSNFTRIVEGEAYKNESGGKNQTYLVQLQDKHNNNPLAELNQVN